MDIRPKGVEPLTYWSVASRSIQLSYGRNLLTFIYNIELLRMQANWGLKFVIKTLLKEKL